MDANRANQVELTIQIKALRLDGKKMTISVFRQLKRSSAVIGGPNDVPRLNDTLNRWGYVRHDDGGGRLWLIAETRGELVRCNLHSADIGYESPKSKLLDKVRADVLANCEQLFIAA
ncbi:hypothetical protein [Variovorax paradoxus]|uniref:Uncharacterized protein n=1 Tax=Variovorax paradoxus TaxID=34073 RepID=A0A0H2MAC9_VARPD|nr:hypothetical protein [Variovorax paradoxus]KLN57627.1 hypothetical protein VPARA_11400 [Variovorax paradoxus]